MMLRYFKHNLPILIFLTILVIISYINTLNNAFVSDDIPDILKNLKISDLEYVLGSVGFIRRLLYFMAYHTGGLNPTSFRLINLLLHLGNCYLVFAIVKRLHQSKIAVLSAALFAVHPILSEPVSWISGGAYVQSTFFLLLSLLFYIKFQNKYNFISWVFFILAGISQVITIILPAILIIYELSFRNLRKNWPLLIPFFLITSVFVAISLLSMSERTQTLQTVHYLEKQTYNPLLVTPIALSSYLELIFFPKDLTLYHSELSLNLWSLAFKVMITIIYLALTIYFFFKNKALFFWLSLFLISLLPTLVTAFLGLTSIVAERYAYFATLGIIVTVSFMVVRITQHQRIKGVIFPIILVIITLGITRTIIRNNDWDNEDNLWIATGKTSPSSPNTHNNLGDVYGRRGDLPKSIQEFQTAIALKPNYADAHHNLGNALIEAGRRDEALQSYQNAIKFNPFLWQSFQNMASIYFSQGQYEKAEIAIKKAVEINPKNLDLQINLGTVYLKMGENEKAKDAFFKILQVDPNNQNARLGLTQASK